MSFTPRLRLTPSARKTPEYMPLSSPYAETKHDPRPDRAGRTFRWTKKNRPWSYLILLAAALFLLDAFKVTTWAVGRIRRRYFRPLDALMDYQTLNTAPILHRYAVTTREERAVVTTMYTDDFAYGVATLGHSLVAAKTQARFILAYFPDKISQRALCIAQTGGWELQAVKRIPPPHNSKGIHTFFKDQYSKLNLWTFDKIGIKSLVYLDADTLVRGNFDELFDLPYQFAAGPDVWTDDRGFVLGFNAGVMMLRPSTAVFHDLVSKMEVANYPLKWAEQGYLNFYFGAHVLRLPFVYNGNVAIKQRSPTLWRAMEQEMRIVHYTLAKPFPPDNGGMAEADQVRAHLEKEKIGKPQYAQELTWWEASWDALRDARWKELKHCDAQYPRPGSVA